MGSEVDLCSDCMFELACNRTVPYFERGGRFYNGRLNMSNMECGCMCSKRGEGGGGSCITWDLKVAFHLLNAHVRRGGLDSPSGSVYPHSSGMRSKGERGGGGGLLNMGS